MMLRSWRLLPITLQGSFKAGNHSGELRVLHQLTNSLPWTQSGYTLRSQHVLKALQEEGIAVEAMTRLGYPLVVGKVMRATYVAVDNTTYHRALPATMPRDLDARLSLQARLLGLHAQGFGAHLIHTTTPYGQRVGG